MNRTTRLGRIYLLALAIWFVFLLLAVGLGAVRQLFIEPALGEPAAHIIGTLAFVAVMLALMAAFVARRRGEFGRVDPIRIGLMWMVLTIAFEFLFFHYVVGKSCETLLADYDLSRGRVWVLVPVTELVGPAILVRMLPRESHSKGSAG